jgi:hypothetical protein
MESSGKLFKNQLDKAFSQPGIQMNSTIMGDAMKYKQSFKEEELEGGVSDKKTLKDIAKKHDKKGYYHIDDMVSSLKKQLIKGMKVEMEHTKNKDKAKEIAMDHIWEDPNYYDKLKKIESKEEKDKKYLDIEDMIPMLKKQLMKGTKVDQQQKKEKTKDKEESKEATGSGSSGAYSGPLFGGEMKEKWSEKYKKSIDCNNPKGFSQKAHCQSKKKETKEATGTGSTGAFTAPVGFKDSEFVRRSFKETPKLKESDVEKVEATEATTTGSSGAYESPSMWAKSTKKKDWGPSRKTQIPGGGFVKINKRCTKFPYCNQGDINNVKISKNESVKEAIQRVSKRIGVSESTIISILEHEYEKVNKRTK